MRILQLHNYYQQSGGEDVVVAAERELLEEHGHDVDCLAVSNDAVRGTWKKVKTAWQAPYSGGGKRLAAAHIASFRPDLVHAHNLFPLLTPAVYDACAEAGVPVVQTLHNFRLICPGSFLMRDGKICEECVHGTPFRAACYRCYRGSLTGSLAVARMVRQHRNRGTWSDKVDCFIALTGFSREKFAQAGFPAGRIAVKPNFLKSSPDANGGGGEYALFVGRLSAEKGVRVLLEAWGKLGGGIPLRIAGDGPLAGEVASRAAALPQVEFLGPRPRGEILKLMQCARFLVFPSIWYEGFPMTILEAFSTGLPVLASDLGSMSSIIDSGRTGLHFRPGDANDLAAKVEWLLSHSEEASAMRKEARGEFEAKYSAERNYRMLMEIYENTIEAKRRAG